MAKDDGAGMRNMTGYDLREFLTTWLRKRKLNEKSVCEVIASDDIFADLRKEVGPADVFWSHRVLDAFVDVPECGSYDESRGPTFLDIVECAQKRAADEKAREAAEQAARKRDEAAAAAAKLLAQEDALELRKLFERSGKRVKLTPRSCPRIRDLPAEIPDEQLWLKFGVASAGYW